MAVRGVGGRNRGKDSLESKNFSSNTPCKRKCCKTNKPLLEKLLTRRNFRALRLSRLVSYRYVIDSALGALAVTDMPVVVPHSDWQTWNNPRIALGFLAGMGLRFRQSDYPRCERG